MWKFHSFLGLGEVALYKGCPMCPRSMLPSCHPRTRDQLTQGRFDLCLQTQFYRLQDCSFLASGVCPLVGGAGLEACAGFLVGGTDACPFVGGAGSWPSGGQSHVKGHV